MSKSLHAALMVRMGINMVNPDGVDAQLGHSDDISLALLHVNERVTWHQLIGDSWTSQKTFSSLYEWRETLTFHVILTTTVIKELGANGTDLVHCSIRRQSLQPPHQQGSRRPRRGKTHCRTLPGSGSGQQKYGAEYNAKCDADKQCGE